MNERLYQHLVTLAGERRLTTYSDIAPLLGLSMDNEIDRERISEILGEILRHEIAQGRPLLTAIVVHRGTDNNPGEGFFSTAREFGRFDGGRDQLRRLEFWVLEVNRVYAQWSN